MLLLCFFFFFLSTLISVKVTTLYNKCNWVTSTTTTNSNNNNTLALSNENISSPVLHSVLGFTNVVIK